MATQLSGCQLIQSPTKKLGGGGADYIVIGAYMGTMDNNKLVSRTGKKPSNNKTITEFWNAAQENGTDWGLIDYNQIRFIMMLGLSEYGNPDIQNYLGNGVSGYPKYWPTSLAQATGLTKTCGDNISTIDTQNILSGSNRICFLGIEDPYGWYHQIIQGIYFGASDNLEQNGREVFIYEGNRLPSENELQTYPEGNYRKFEISIDEVHSSNSTHGIICKMQLGEYFDLFLKESYQSNDKLFWCNDFYFYPKDQIFTWAGCGASYAPSHSGLGSMYTQGFLSKSSDISTRLAYYGDIQFVPSSAIE